MEHARLALKGPRGDLFPDQRSKSGTKFGDPLDYCFRLLIQHQISGNPEGKAARRAGFVAGGTGAAGPPWSVIVAMRAPRCSARSE